MRVFVDACASPLCKSTTSTRAMPRCTMAPTDPVTDRALRCPVCPDGPPLSPSGRTGVLSGHLCLHCGTSVMTTTMGSGSRAGLTSGGGIADPGTRLVQNAIAAHARVARANVLSEQADCLLTESERLIAEAQDLLQDAAEEE